MDELANDMGVLPDIGKLVKNPLSWTLVFKLLFGPSFAAQWQLEGNDANEGAFKLISSL